MRRRTVLLILFVITFAVPTAGGCQRNNTPDQKSKISSKLPEHVAEKYLRFLMEDQNRDNPGALMNLTGSAMDMPVAMSDSQKIRARLLSAGKDAVMRFSELKVSVTENDGREAKVSSHGTVLVTTPKKVEKNVLDAELYLELRPDGWHITKTVGVIPVDSGITLGIVRAGMERFTAGSSDVSESVKALCKAIEETGGQDEVLSILRKRFGKMRGGKLSPPQFLVLNAVASAFVTNHLRGFEHISVYATSDSARSEGKPTDITPYATSISLILKPLFLQVVREILPETKDHWRLLVLDSRYIIPVIYGDPVARRDGYAYDLVYPAEHLAFSLGEAEDQYAVVKSLFPGVENVEVFDPVW
jgi:hypothetical protein